jgi:hypothetical protein
MFQFANSYRKKLTMGETCTHSSLLHFNYTRLEELVSQMLMHKQRQLEREQIHAWNKNK